MNVTCHVVRDGVPGGPRQGPGVWRPGALRRVRQCVRRAGRLGPACGCSGGSLGAEPQPPRPGPVAPRRLRCHAGTARATRTGAPPPVAAHGRHGAPDAVGTPRRAPAPARRRSPIPAQARSACRQRRSGCRPRRRPSRRRCRHPSSAATAALLPSSPRHRWRRRPLHRCRPAPPVAPAAPLAPAAPRRRRAGSAPTLPPIASCSPPPAPAHPPSLARRVRCAR